MRDSMCPCVPKRVCDAFCLCAQICVQVCMCVCVCVQHSENGAIHRIIDSSLKRRACICISGHGREKNNRKKDRMREKEREKKKRAKGVLGEWTTLAKPLGDKSCGQDQVFWAGIWPQVPSKQMENNRLRVNRWQGNDSSVKSYCGEREDGKKGGQQRTRKGDVENKGLEVCAGMTKER